MVHYDPRPGWKSSLPSQHIGAGFSAKVMAKFKRKVSHTDWLKKKEHIQRVRLSQLEPIKQKLKFWPKNEGDWGKLYDVFKRRAAEYDEEDYEYRYGYYAKHATLCGPFVRLNVRPSVNMVGDHDLFGFTQNTYGKLVPDTTLNHVQRALQRANQFQAQHGGI